MWVVLATLDRMTGTAARSADEVNAEIRELWVDGTLTDEARYRVLLVEWAEAVRAEQQLAA